MAISASWFPDRWENFWKLRMDFQTYLGMSTRLFFIYLQIIKDIRSYLPGHKKYFNSDISSHGSISKCAVFG